MEQRKLALVLASCSTFLLSFWNYNSKLEREQVLIIFQGSSPNTWRRYDRSINDIELIVDRRSVCAHTTNHSNDVAGAVSVWCNFVCRSSARQLTFFLYIRSTLLLLYLSSVVRRTTNHWLSLAGLEAFVTTLGLYCENMKQEEWNKRAESIRVNWINIFVELTKSYLRFNDLKWNLFSWVLNRWLVSFAFSRPKGKCINSTKPYPWIMVDGKKYRNIKVEKLRRAAVEWFRLNLAELWDSSSSMLRIKLKSHKKICWTTMGLMIMRKKVE